MVSKRKLWATNHPSLPGSEKRRHESQAAVYRYAQAQAANWLAGALRPECKTLAVHVDERDGRGWQLYERLDLSTLGA